jgi:zinc transport system substrate-binding protein
MKKFIVAILCICLSAVVALPLTACGTKNNKISIVCTVFAQYDWVKEIIGDNSDKFSVKYLLGTGVDLHNYAPKTKDVTAISTSDLFIYVGGESDEWVEEVLEDAENKDMLKISLLDELENPLLEETKEGMEPEEEEEEEECYDEHVWLSLKNAKIFISVIKDAICELDSANAAVYTKNAENYTEQLDILDFLYQSAADSKTFDTVLFADRMPFLYMLNDYGINYYAAFIGCSSSTEASVPTLTFLTGKVNQLGLEVILVTETSDKRIAQTVKDSSTEKNQRILVMSAGQSVSKEKIGQGVSYLSIMQDNLVVLGIALGLA